MAKTIHIAFSGGQFDVAPLNFGQLEEIMPLIPDLKGPRSVSAMLDVVQVMLREAYPDVAVRKLPVDLAGMKAAVSDVLGFSGLEMKVSTPGEAQAGVTSTSGTFAAG